MIKRLYGKIDAYVTDANKHYEGSITIGKNLADAIGVDEYEAVFVNSIDTGFHWETYVIFGEDGEVCLNGAAANHFEIGEKVHILAHHYVDTYRSRYEPRIVKCNEKNEIL